MGDCLFTTQRMTRASPILAAVAAASVYRDACLAARAIGITREKGILCTHIYISTMHIYYVVMCVSAFQRESANPTSRHKVDPSRRKSSVLKGLQKVGSSRKHNYQCKSMTFYTWKHSHPTEWRRSKALALALVMGLCLSRSE